MTKRLYLLIVLIVLQITIISFLAYKIMKHKRNVLGESSINAIPKEDLDLSLRYNLKYFYEPKPNTKQVIDLDLLPEKVIYTINSDSLNEKFDYSIDKLKGVFRIITIGDSFTFGQNVSTEKNWTEILENRLNQENRCLDTVKKYEVINLGVYGYDTVYSVERYKLRGQKYDPDLVIWTFSDFERLLEIMIPLTEKYDTPQNKALEKQGIFYQNWILARKEMLSKMTQNDLIDIQTKEIKKLDSYYQGKLLYFALPNKEEYLSILKDSAKKRQNSFFSQTLFDYSNKKYFLLDSHLNTTGHQKIAEDVFEYLTKNKMIPCN